MGPGTGSRLRVLLAEDVEHDVEVLRRELIRGGYDPATTVVQRREEMEAALEQHTFDLVISDYNLPQFSGLEALQVLQRSGRDIPFIVVSGQITRERAIELMRAGASDFVMKQDLLRLLPVIDRELRESHHRRERRRAEEALRASELRYRELFENANDVVFTLDLEGRFTSLNRAGEAIAGYSREEAANLHLSRTSWPLTASKRFARASRREVRKQVRRPSRPCSSGSMAGTCRSRSPGAPWFATGLSSALWASREI